jgi:hypothetical protein
VLITTLDALALLFAIGTLSYTGILVSGMPSLPLLNSPLITALFIVSSLSCGSAIITLYGFLNQSRKSMHFGMKLIPRLDILLLLCELILLLALFATAFNVDKNSISDPATSIILGELAPLFWIGVGICGLAAPVFINICIESMTSDRGNHMTRKQKHRHQNIAEELELVRGLGIKIESARAKSSFLNRQTQRNASIEPAFDWASYQHDVVMSSKANGIDPCFSGDSAGENLAGHAVWFAIAALMLLALSCVQLLSCCGTSGLP